MDRFSGGSLHRDPTIGDWTESTQKEGQVAFSHAGRGGLPESTRKLELQHVGGKARGQNA